MTFDTSASEDFVTIQELALHWRVTPQHIFNLVRHGRLPAHRIGRRLIVRRDAAKRFLESNATASAGPLDEKNESRKAMNGGASFSTCFERRQVLGDERCENTNKPATKRKRLPQVTAIRARQIGGVMTHNPHISTGHVFVTGKVLRRSKCDEPPLRTSSKATGPWAPRQGGARLVASTAADGAESKIPARRVNTPRPVQPPGKEENRVQRRYWTP